MKTSVLDDQSEEYITVLYAKTGQVTTRPRADAKRDIAFGQAIETVPSNAKQAKAWLAELRARVIDEMHANGARNASPFLGLKLTSMDVFRDWEDWCRENGVHPLPVQNSNNVVRWLLGRRAEGAIEAHVNVYADILSAFHACTRHPTMRDGRIIRGSLSAEARAAFNRAMAFGGRRLAEETRKAAQRSPEAAARALRMFPDGSIPAHWHEIAA